MQGGRLHAPAHLDAEVLSALGRLHRAGHLAQADVADLLGELAAAPIQRHPLAGLLSGAWERRANLSLLDGLYVELADSLAAVLLTTDARLARSIGRAELAAEDQIS
jgi:predicted nucleic acid-binding protein